LETERDKRIPKFIGKLTGYLGLAYLISEMVVYRLTGSYHAAIGIAIGLIWTIVGCIIHEFTE